MRKHYLHLAVYRCDKCQGPVVTGSVAVRESEISKETEKQEIGAICLLCGYRQSKATEPAHARHLLPMDWPPEGAVYAGHPTTAVLEALETADLH
jgi:hypothetical protein